MLYQLAWWGLVFQALLLISVGVWVPYGTMCALRMRRQARSWRPVWQAVVRGMKRLAIWAAVYLVVGLLSAGVSMLW